MKIQKVIFSIDDNPHYMGFWSSISRHYKTKLGMSSKLFVLSNDSLAGDKYDKSYGEVEVVPLLSEFPPILQALMAKFYFVVTEKETLWMVGDLDLYPMQTQHFIDDIANIPDDAYVHLNPYAYGVDWRKKVDGLAGYFHVAKGRIFEEELGFHKSFHEVCSEVFSGPYGIRATHNGCAPVSRQASKHWGWFCCEEMYTGKLLRASQRLIELAPKHNERIDRSNMSYVLGDIPKGRYVDFHSPRPYEEHQQVIELIASCVKPRD